jgi:hypothetical protein
MPLSLHQFYSLLSDVPVTDPNTPSTQHSVASAAGPCAAVHSAECDRHPVRRAGRGVQARCDKRHDVARRHGAGSHVYTYGGLAPMRWLLTQARLVIGDGGCRRAAHTSRRGASSTICSTSTKVTVKKRSQLLQSTSRILNIVGAGGRRSHHDIVVNCRNGE